MAAGGPAKCPGRQQQSRPGTYCMGVASSVFVLVLLAIFVGAIAQRIAGLGFALLIAPFLVLILGPHEGVLMVNICGVVSSTLIMARVWRDVDWSMVRWLSVPAIAGSVAGSVATAYVPAAPLSVTVGAVVLAALLVSLVLQRSDVVVRGNPPKVLAGLAAGLTNSMAGVGGPAVSAYALLARWPQRPFAATLQPFFVFIGLVTLGTKFAVDPGQAPALHAWMWAAITAVIVLGIYAGERLARHVRDEHARLAVVVIAFAGALAALVKGLADLQA